MRFGRYLHHLSMLMILTGFYSISITGSEYVSAVFAGMVVTGLYWILGERISAFLKVPRTLWNLLALLLFSYFFYDTFFGNQDLVGNGIMFVIYLQMVKLLSHKTNRDWMQIYTLSFMHILASTVLTSDIAFSVPFLIYVILATWTLVLFNLKMQLELTTAPEKKDHRLQSLLLSKNVITKKFLITTSFLSISIITFTLIVFFSFPRLSMGNFLKRITTRNHISGFSDRVELGTIGTIKTNSQITMRVEIDQETAKKIEIDQIHWRGTATDNFDGRVWSKNSDHKRRVAVDMDTGMLTLDRRPFPGGNNFEYRIFLEALNPPVLFSADRLYQLIWDKPMVERIFRRSMGIRYDYNGTFYLSSSANIMSDLTYRAESIIGDPQPDLLRSAKGRLPSWMPDYFLQLPELRPQVERTLASIPIGSGSTYDKVLAIKNWLETNYTYTLNVEDFGTEDPLSFFLLEKKQGHCEYFSTAFAIALRFHGIPSRNVVGFRGGEFNDFGNYIAVRQSDAHSWVEVFFPTYGWIAFDPSPLDSTVGAPRPRWRRINQFFDNLRLRWNKYIIEYDLRAQAEIAENVGRKVSRWFRSNTSKKETDSTPNTRSWNTPKNKTFFANLLLLAFLVWLTAYLIYRFKQNPQRRGVFAQVIRLLEARGHRKKTHETIPEFCARVQRKEGPLPPLNELVSMYDEERFGQILHSKIIWTRNLTSLKTKLHQRKKQDKAA